MLHIQTATTRHATSHTIRAHLGAVKATTMSASTSTSAAAAAVAAAAKIVIVRFFKTQPPTHHKPPTVGHQGDLYIPTRNILHPEVIMETSSHQHTWNSHHWRLIDIKSTTVYTRILHGHLQMISHIGVTISKENIGAAPMKSVLQKSL